MACVSCAECLWRGCEFIGTRPAERMQRSRCQLNWMWTNVMMLNLLEASYDDTAQAKKQIVRMPPEDIVILTRLPDEDYTLL